MKKVEYWEAFDGKRFEEENACGAYEEAHPFFDNKRIQFYSNNGHLISKPCENVFLDSNRFEVFDKEALEAYANYCNFLRIKAPARPTLVEGFPLHYRFLNGTWECIEEKIFQLHDSLLNDFNSNVIEDADEHHDLMEFDNEEA